MDEIIYLELDEEIPSVIDKMKNLSGKSVALVIPKGASIIQSVINLKILKTNNIDLVFMDVRLPGINGHETTRKIRATDKNIKIIAQTAYASQKDLQESLNVGCNDYITKPIQKEKLLEIIDKYLMRP